MLGFGRWLEGFGGLFWYLCCCLGKKRMHISPCIIAISRLLVRNIGLGFQLFGNGNGVAALVPKGPK